MAGLRKIKGKYYIRLFLPNGREKLIGTGTGNKIEAEAKKRLIEDREFLVKARLADEMGESVPRLFEAVTDYLSDSKIKHQPETYRTNAKALDALKNCWGDINLKQLNPKHLSVLQQYLSARLGPTTVNIRLRSIRAFLNWCVNTERMEQMPGKVSLVRVDDELPKFFEPGELAKIFDQVNNQKMKATFRVLAETGLRRAELGNCTLENGYLHLRRTKGRRERLVRLPEELFADFLLATDKPYKPDSISGAFLTALRKAGVEQRGRSLHSLRHTYALREYSRSRDIYLVKNLLGHSAVAVTERYLKFPLDYLERVFGQSDSRIALVEKPPVYSSEKPAFQA